jgi:excinuclease ABC subunit C
MSVAPHRAIRETLDRIPAEPGVYLMEDREGVPIYIGKGRDLRARVRSYFQESRPPHPRIDALVSRVRRIRWIVTDSEVEALILECNLIKEHSPRYNVNLKDDKRYPYIKVTVNEPFPRIVVTRRIRDDGARYFGPFTAVGKMRASLQLITKIFPVRGCHYNLTTDRPSRACLDHHIGKCLGPCVGYQSREAYRKMIDEVVLFLSGRNRRVIRDLERRMKRAVERMDYEEAARIRDQVDGLRSVQERQKVFSVRPCDRDLVALCREGDEACGLVMKIREGRLLGSRHLMLENVRWQDDAAILSLFLARFYQTETDIAREILLPFDCDDRELLGTWFAARNGNAPELRVPRRGEPRRLLELAGKNCRLVLQELRSRRIGEEDRSRRGVEELRRVLGLEARPRAVVCVDISQIQGRDAVGAVVRFHDGMPLRSGYRRFRMRTVEGQDDFAMMREVLGRYLKGREREEDLPDLILLDGGRGQLSAGVEVLNGFGLVRIPIFALAKKREELFRPGDPRPIRLPARSPGLWMLARLRDEAHRFAVEYHRRLRSGRYRESLLDEIPGIGRVRKRNLLRAFGSVRRIEAATVEEIARVDGFSESLSRRIKTFLNE